MDEHKQVIEVATFDDLNDVITTVIVIERAGADLKIPIRELSYTDYIQVELDYPLPEPPKIGTKDGPRYDRENPEYRGKVVARSNEWTLRRMARSLRITIPGDTEDERIAHLRTLPAQIVRTLGDQIELMHQRTVARIENRADGFQPIGIALVEDAGPEGLDA